MSCEAESAYRRGLDIMRYLTTLAPDHAPFKRDLDWFEAQLRELSAPAAPPPSDTPPRGTGGGWLDWWRKR
jgi:hypothetical protein